MSEHRVAVKFGCQQIARRIGKTKLGANKSVRSLKKFEMAINLKSKKHAKCMLYSERISLSTHSGRNMKY